MKFRVLQLNIKCSLSAIIFTANSRSHEIHLQGLPNLDNLETLVPAIGYAAQGLHLEFGWSANYYADAVARFDKVVRAVPHPKKRASLTHKVLGHLTRGAKGTKTLLAKIRGRYPSTLANSAFNLSPQSTVQSYSLVD